MKFLELYESWCRHNSCLSLMLLAGACKSVSLVWYALFWEPKQQLESPRWQMGDLVESWGSSILLSEFYFRFVVVPAAAAASAPFTLVLTLALALDPTPTSATAFAVVIKQNAFVLRSTAPLSVCNQNLLETNNESSSTREHFVVQYKEHMMNLFWKRQFHFGVELPRQPFSICTTFPCRLSSSSPSIHINYSQTKNICWL